MAFDAFRSIGHSEITAAKALLAVVAAQSASPFLSRLAVPGQIGYLFELLLSAAAVVLGAIGLFWTFALRPRDFFPAHMDEQQASNNEREAWAEGAAERNVEITVRLEDGSLPALRRHRCVVTIHSLSAGVQDAGREVWYARGTT